MISLQGKRAVIMTGLAAAVVVLLVVINLVYVSEKPDFFPVTANPAKPPGVLYTETAARLLEHELRGPGGWLPNDMLLSPTRLLDNKPNFQLGVLEVVRYSARILRDNLSRQRTTDTIDADCDKAFTCFSNDPRKWIMPSAEGKYKEGITALHKYSQRIEFKTARFYPRSDNLIQLLEQYVSLLGGINTRLLNASRKHVVAGDDRDNLPQSSPIPWHEIDDNFYYAQGVGYALYHMFQSLKGDFDQVLQDKNARVIAAAIIASLEETCFEPLIVTNGGKAGIFANHSSNLRVFLDDARQKTASLIRILDQG